MNTMKSTINALFTIGYEGAELSDFLATLRRTGVTTLLDVRELPLSRKKGFSKRALEAAVMSVGIEYRHERGLGSPKRLRTQLHGDGDYKSFFAAFSTYLRAQEPLLKQLAGSLEGGVALMCFERDPATCHRSIVAKRLGQLVGVEARHLGVTHDIRRNGAGVGVGQGVSSA